MSDYQLLPRKPDRKQYGVSRFPYFNLPDFLEDLSQWIPSFSTEQGGLDVYEDKKNVYVQAALPGLNVDNVSVTLEKGTLQIKGEKQEEEKTEDRKYYSRSQRSFFYQVTIPAQVDEKQEPQASYEDGILKVTLAKANPSQTKKIKVSSSKNKTK